MRSFSIGEPATFSTYSQRTYLSGLGRIKSIEDPAQRPTSAAEMMLLRSLQVGEATAWLNVRYTQFTSLGLSVGDRPQAWPQAVRAHLSQQHGPARAWAGSAAFILYRLMAGITAAGAAASTVLLA